MSQCDIPYGRGTVCVASNLHLLVTGARDWVAAQFDELCDLLTAELEPKSYDVLLAMDGITYTAPGADDVHNARPAV